MKPLQPSRKFEPKRQPVRLFRPSPPRPQKREPDWPALYRQMGLSVTVCIAVKAHMDGCIVTVSDKRLSYGDELGAADNAAMKTLPIGNRWGVLWAAEDISPVSDLIKEIHYQLHDKPNADRATVQEIVAKAYNEAAQRRAADQYLACYGVHSVAEFRKTGLAEFGPELFGQIMEKISSYDLGIQLLVHGFSPPPYHSFMHIFEVRNPGICFDHQVEGYGVIGSGSMLALSSMMSHSGGFGTIEEAVYRALEAKFMAETASGVGRATTAAIHTPHGHISHVSPGVVDQIRAVWEATRKQEIPDDAWSVLHESLKSLNDAIQTPPVT